MWRYWPLTRYVNLRVAHAPGIPGTFSPPPISKETDSYRSRHVSRHVRYARAVMHVGIPKPRWRGKRCRHSWRMRNPQFEISGKKPITPRNKKHENQHTNRLHNSCVILLMYVCISLYVYMRRYFDNAHNIKYIHHRYSESECESVDKM